MSSPTFKAIPVTLLYQWLKRTTGTINIFKFASCLPPMTAKRKISSAAALAMIPHTCEPKKAMFYCYLPTSLYLALCSEAPEGTKLQKFLGEVLAGRLVYFTGAVKPHNLRFGDYTGLRTHVKFEMTNHEVVAIKVLARALQMEEWQLTTLLLDGLVIQASEVKFK